MIERDILAETKNLYVCRERGVLRLYLKGVTHSVSIGNPLSIDAAMRTMQRLERYPDNLRAMYAHY